MTVALTQVERIWDQLFPDEQIRIIKLLVEKVIVTSDNIEVRLRNNGIEKLALEMAQPAQEEACA